MLEDLASRLVLAARRRGVRVATAESCTGGLLAGAITEVPGASHMFDRGAVTYSNQAKQEMLGVSGATLAAHGAVSEPVAREMAEGILARSRAELTISITGIAGPGPSEHKPEGRVCFALARQNGPTTSETVDFGPLGRSQVRRAAVAHALDRLLAAVGEGPAPREG